MSRGSRLLPGTALLRSFSSSESPHHQQLIRRRASAFAAGDDIDKKLMDCYNDSEFGQSVGLSILTTASQDSVGS